jgi:hypothetical protein
LQAYSAVNLQAFEARVLDMWMTTRIPLTRPNIQFDTRAPRPKVEQWLDQMVGEGVLEVDADDDGEMVWTVRGAVRSKTGPSTVAEVAKLDSLRAEVGGAGSALVLASRAAGLSSTRRGGGGGEVADRKSLIASGALSFFFGPVGWLYAAPLREAVPAIAGYLALWWVLGFLHLGFLMSPVVLISVLGGLAYAWRYNQTGERTSLLGDVERVLPPRR